MAGVLISPLTMRGLTLPNRIVISPAWASSTPSFATPYCR